MQLKLKILKVSTNQTKEECEYSEEKNDWNFCKWTI